jgi:hypothetical protein
VLQVLHLSTTLQADTVPQYTCPNPSSSCDSPSPTSTLHPRHIVLSTGGMFQKITRPLGLCVTRLLMINLQQQLHSCVIGTLRPDAWRATLRAGSSTWHVSHRTSADTSSSMVQTVTGTGVACPASRHQQETVCRTARHSGTSSNSSMLTQHSLTTTWLK